MEHRIESRNSYRGFSCVDRFIETRCAYIDELYEDMKQNGYRTDAGEAGPGTSWHSLDPMVSIARDGGILFSKGGKHRFAIAQLLGIDIPCHIVVRHGEWQRFRDRLVEDGVDAPGAWDHPDLRDIVDVQ